MVRTTPAQRATMVALVVLVGLVIGLPFADIDINVGALALGLGVVLCLLFPRGAEEAVREIDWSTILLVGGIVRFEYGTVAGAENLLEPALAGFRSTGDRWGQWAALYWLSLVAENRGDFAAAVALGEEPERLATRSLRSARTRWRGSPAGRCRKRS